MIDLIFLRATLSLNRWKSVTIILKGEWLRELGFNCNDKIEVFCEKNKITIMKIDKD